ncbi:MAG TPA: extracellular solute-binding protein [Gemmataceae bacterium]|jgi:iron(III) transport system substrate-binding protein|nr:extracellular solute-binding protein [Gemmataceae bacterium]
MTPSLRRLILLTVIATGCRDSDKRVVVYCAQDEEFAEGVFADFSAASTLAVAPKFDTEANKSVSLAAELERETSRPRCDVHWNNEILATIRLARLGVYESYESPGAAAFPEWTKAKDHTWQAFAARARVLIVNTNLVPLADRPRSMLDLTDPHWKGKVAIAKPQFGTTATQAACLFEVLGQDAAKTFYRGLKANNVRVVPGNKQAAEGVASGDFAIGLTDSDDALIELNAGKPVAIVFPDPEGHPTHNRMGVLYIPNTVAVVKGCPNPAGAKQLIDHLLRPETEAKLAAGGGFQIPLNPIVKADMPAALLPPSKVKPMVVDWDHAADLWDETQTFLRDEFAR